MAFSRVKNSYSFLYYTCGRKFSRFLDFTRFFAQSGPLDRPTVGRFYEFGALAKKANLSPTEVLGRLNYAYFILELRNNFLIIPLTNGAIFATYQLYNLAFCSGISFVTVIILLMMQNVFR